MVGIFRACGLHQAVLLAAWLSLPACSSSSDAKGTGAANVSGDGGGKDATPNGFGKCGDTPPAGATVAPDPKPYTGGTCPTLTTGADHESTITSSGVSRQLMIVVPDEPRTDETLPVVFLWHWLNASAKSFYDRASVKDAVNQQRFIAVLPESIGPTPSDWRGWLALNDVSQEEEEFTFFDDMLACVSAQFPVDKNCVSSAGVSDGALWTSQLIGGRGEYLSSAIVLSGGVGGSYNTDGTGAVLRDYIPSTAHVLPAIILWGGPTDTFIINFEPATKALERHMDEEGHFIVECQHNCGHDEPPFVAPPGESKFAAFWDFVNDHPYWLPPGSSPYGAAGKLPSTFPAWCAMGVGSAVERTGAGCANLIGAAISGATDAGP